MDLLRRLVLPPLPPRDTAQRNTQSRCHSLLGQTPLAPKLVEPHASFWNPGSMTWGDLGHPLGVLATPRLPARRGLGARRFSRLQPTAPASALVTNWFRLTFLHSAATT